MSLRTIQNDRLVDGAKLDNAPADINAELGDKQDTLVSGINIKTLNGVPLLGSGDIAIAGVNSVNGETGTVILTTDDIGQVADFNYVSDVGLAVLGNTSGVNTGDQSTMAAIADTMANFNLSVTDGDFAFGGGTASGTNTGDQTTIVGITGTKAQFDTAVTDGDFVFGGGTATGTNTGDQIAATVPFTPTATIAATDVQAAIAELELDKIATTALAAANGVATLDAGGKIPSSQIPSLALTEYLGNFSDTTAALADAGVMASQAGDWFTVNTSGGLTYIVTTNNPTTVADITLVKTPTAAVTSVNGQTGVVSLTTADVADSSNKRYVTDAQLVVIGNTSGTNTGDQTNISGNAATATSATNTAITDDTTTNATMYPTWVTASTGNLPQKVSSSKMTFNPSTGRLTSTSFGGAGTGLTGTAASLTAGNVTTNANLTGDVTSVGNATTLTNAPVIAKVLTGYVSGAGTVSATDSILQAIQKLNGNDATNANLTGAVTSIGNATSLGSFTKSQLNTAVSDGDVVYLDSADTITGVKTFSTAPVINALPTGTAVASVATASTLVSRTTDGNSLFNNVVESLTTTVTAAGTTTLTVSSTYGQQFTGSTTQTVVLPVAATLTVGHSFMIMNRSSGVVTVNSSGGNLVQTMAASSQTFVTCVLASGTTAASWDSAYSITNAGSGGGTVTSVSSANSDATVATGTTTPVITIVSAPKLTTARLIGGTSFDGTADITPGLATTVTTNANLTGHVTSVGNAAVLGSFTKAQLNTAISDGDAMYLDSTDTITGAKTFSTAPVLNALPTGTAITSAATASTIVTRDSSANISFNNWVGGYATTVTAAETTTLTVASANAQFFTGTTTQTVTLPVATTLTTGFQFEIVNNSTGLVTVNSSGGNAVLILAGGTAALITCILASGTTAASWNAIYIDNGTATGKKLTVSNSLTFTGTDASSVAFGTGGTVLYSGGALGTPSSGTLTNATGLPIAGLTASTSTAIGVGSVELGHATDTTIARSSAGVISVEGVVIPSISSTNTLTNKRVTRRAPAVTQSATPTINTDNTDVAHITALAQAITSMTTNLTGTPVEGDMLRIDITDNGTARAITWGASFEASTVALPTTTVISTRLDVGFIWNTVTSKWRCVAVA